MLLAERISSISMEVSSILSTSALFTFGKITSVLGSLPDYKMIWFNAAAQLATELIFAFMEFVTTGKFHRVKWKNVYPRSIKNFLLFVLPVLALGGTRCVALFDFGFSMGFHACLPMNLQAVRGIAPIILPKSARKRNIIRAM